MRTRVTSDKYNTSFGMVYAYDVDVEDYEEAKAIAEKMFKNDIIADLKEMCGREW